jgi:signal transduction histidine kinase
MKRSQPGAEMEVSTSLRHIRQSLHQLAQPLAAVTGMVDLLLLEIDEHQALFKEVQLISQQLEKVLEIVGEIRHIALEGPEGEEKSPGPDQGPTSSGPD